MGVMSHICLDQSCVPADVLVVDDHVDLLDLIRIVLEREGYTVASSLTAEAALATIDCGRPGLVLSDIYMPGMDGLMLADRLRRRPDPVPVMLMSADRFALPEDIPFIPKPFDLGELVSIIAATLDRTVQAN
ncbi:MAG: response regulator transcription factor [Thermomicrobiales bacterium]